MVVTSQRGRDDVVAFRVLETVEGLPESLGGVLKGAISSCLPRRQQQQRSLRPARGRTRGRRGSDLS